MLINTKYDPEQVVIFKDYGGRQRRGTVRAIGGYWKKHEGSISYDIIAEGGGVFVVDEENIFPGNVAITIDGGDTHGA